MWFGGQVAAQEQLRFFVNNQEATGTAAIVYGPSFSLRMEGFSGGAIYFTSDGSEPTRSSPRHTGARTFRSSATIRALALSADETVSQAAELNVTLLPFLKLRVSGPTKFVEYSLDGGDFRAYAPGKTFQEVAGGRQVALRAVPTNGWIFDRWLGHHASAEQTNVFIMDRSHEVRLSMYRTNVIEVAVSGDGEVVVEPPPPYFWENRDVQITAIPRPGSYFSGWSVQKPISFNQWADAVPPSATFAPLPEGSFAISVKIDGIGSVFLPAGYKAAAGSAVKVVAQPASSYYLKEWSGDATGKGVPSASPYGSSVTLTMDSSKSVVAHLGSIPTKRISDFYWATLSDPSVAPNGLAICAARIVELPTNYTAVAFDRDGVIRWEVYLPVPVKDTVQTPCIGPDGTIYFAATNGVANGRVVAMSPAREVLWQVEAPGREASVAASAYGLYVASTNDSGGGIRRFWLDGSLLGEASGATPNTFGGLRLDGDSNPILGGDVALAFTVDLLPRWQANLAVSSRPTLLDARGNVIFDNLQALHGKTAAPLWMAPYADGRATSLGTNRVYIIENSNGRLSALDLETGQKVWTTAEQNSSFRLGRTVAAEDGTVFAVYGGGINSLLRHVSATGEILWETLVGNTGVPLLTPDGCLHMLGISMNVGVGPARSGFPMFRGDWRNSGSLYTGSSPEVNALSFDQSPQGLILKFLPPAKGTLELQWSVDLVAWSKLQTFSTPLNYPVAAPLEGRRFYRVVQP